MSKKIQLLILILVAAIFFVAGYELSTLKNKTTNNSFQAGYDAAKQRLEENSPSLAKRENIEIKKVTGEITAIDGNKITLKIKPLEPLADSSLDSRTVLVGAETKVYKLEQKDAKGYMLEMQAYQKDIKANISSTSTTPAAPTPPPSRLSKKEISVADLNVGDRISVSADVNIKDLPEFNGTEITYSPTSIIAPTSTAPINNRPTSSVIINK